MDEPQRDEPGLDTWLKRLELFSLLVTVGSLGVAWLNVMALTKFDLETLPAVLRGLDFVTVAFGAVLTVSLVVPWAVVAWLTPGFVERKDIATGRKYSIGLGVVLLMLALLPMVVAGMTVAYWLWLLTMTLLRRRWSRGLPDSLPLRLGRHYASLIVGATLVVSPYLGEIGWMPMERVEAKQRTYLGWVLESGDHDLSLLEESSRRPVMIRQEDILGRTFCTKRTKDQAPARLSLGETLDDVSAKVAHLTAAIASQTLWSLITEGSRPERLPPCATSVR